MLLAAPISALAGLDLVPLGGHLGGSIGAGFGENVGVAADELGDDRRYGVIDIEGALGAANLTVEDDLHEEVAELVAVVADLAPGDGVQDLVALFDQVGLEAGQRLFLIPGAAVGPEEAAHDRDQLGESGAQAGLLLVRADTHRRSIGDGRESVLDNRQ